MTDATVYVLFGLGGLVVLLLFALRSVKIIAPDETGVVVVLGTYKRLLGPGIAFVQPIARVIRLKMGTQTLPLGTWTVPVGSDGTALSGSLSFRITDPARATFMVANLRDELLAQTRAAVAASLAGSAGARTSAGSIELAADARSRLDSAAIKLGVQVESVQVQPIRV